MTIPTKYRPAQPEAGIASFPCAASATETINPSYASIQKWGELTSMSRATTYRALKRGVLRAVKLNTTTLIDVGHGLAYLRGLPRYVPIARRDQ